MIRWSMGKEHPLKGGGKFVPLQLHEGVYFGRRQLPGEAGWHAHNYPVDTEEVLNIPIPNQIWYVDLYSDNFNSRYIMGAMCKDVASANREKRRYVPDNPIPGQDNGYSHIKRVIISAEGEVQDPAVWNAAVNGVLDLLRVNNDLTEDRQEIIESLLRE